MPALGPVIGLICLAPATAAAQPPFITMASTTSTEQSGLLDHLLPVFERRSGIHVRVIALGTGQALDIGRRGDADLVFTHDAVAERKMVAEGWFVDRREVMYNDFLLVGPKTDPAAIGGGRDVVAAFLAVRRAAASMVSRGDNSGTHAAERRIWDLGGVDIARSGGRWYRETGSGMGQALNTASAFDAYILTDRGSWLSFRNRGNLVPLVEGDPRLFNQYAVMLVNPDRHRHVKHGSAKAFADWVVSAEGQATIAGYRIGGEQLFFPNAAP